MSNKRKLKHSKAYVVHGDPIEHAVKALIAAGQQSIACQDCGVAIPMEVMLDSHGLIDWCMSSSRICPEHGLEALCPPCYRAVKEQSTVI